MPKAETVAIQNEVNDASSAAARAGMICSGSVSGSSWVIDAARMPTAPASSDDTSVLTTAMRAGDRPPSIAADSFSAAARVASPNLVHLKMAHSAIVTTMISPVRMNRSTPIGAPSNSIPFCGRIVGSGCGVVPNAIRHAACAISSTPSEDISRASGEEVRSGRKTANSTSAPQATTNSRLSGNAAAIGSVAILPVVSDQ